MRNLFLFLLIIQTTKFCSANDDGLTFSFEMHVQNGINDPIWVHCASKNDEIGEFHLQPGQEIKWDFNVQFFLKTMYFCHFWWNQKKLDNAFEVFNKSYYYKCSHQDGGNGVNPCYWLAKPDGFYFATTNGPFPGSDWTLVHTWTDK
ncbi:S-protein-like [Heracleum sosnowskyi]|uniref:S-protein homolog n=1 Tax=Heracleum sosnowskyi TaxID=360622 RepID=A0AAD8H7H1_9APIA|nr:S-protein-like [Heracleum sosnowskyi]